CVAGDGVGRLGEKFLASRGVRVDPELRPGRDGRGGKQRAPFQPLDRAVAPGDRACRCAVAFGPATLSPAPAGGAAKPEYPEPAHRTSCALSPVLNGVEFNCYRRLTPGRVPIPRPASESSGRS